MSAGGMFVIGVMLIAIFTGAVYPPVQALSIIVTVACGVLFLMAIIIFNIADARRAPPKSVAVRIILNVVEIAVLLFIVYTVVSIVLQCRSPSGCR